MRRSLLGKGQLQGSQKNTFDSVLGVSEPLLYWTPRKHGLSAYNAQQEPHSTAQRDGFETCTQLRIQCFPTSNPSTGQEMFLASLADFVKRQEPSQQPLLR
jgi:hypothetical protein